jgi:L-2-hydroxyglutarate oxidase LhgO
LSAADFDSVVVGAGVIGLAVARELAMSGHSVLIIEKAARVGTETSSRNSEVIHAGIYYPTGSLKAQLCLEGRKRLYEYCKARDVQMRQCGKLIVATSAAEEAKLDAIKALATSNGVLDLQWLSPAEVEDLEPEVSCTKALFSPSTGIVDATGFMLALQADAEMHGTAFALNTRFVSACKQDDLFVVQTTDVSRETAEITCHSLFNCAGHGAHEVATGIDVFDTHKCPPRYLAKGSYCSVSGKSPFQHLVYPVPVSGALGIHATLDLSGAVRFGPDIAWVDVHDYDLPEGLPEKFSAAIQSYWPSVCDRTLRPSYCGIRPKIHGPNSGFADFMIQTEADHGLVGLVNFFGVESPGLTASLAIADYALRAITKRHSHHHMENT